MQRRCNGAWRDPSAGRLCARGACRLTSGSCPSGGRGGAAGPGRAWCAGVGAVVTSAVAGERGLQLRFELLPVLGIGGAKFGSPNRGFGPGCAIFIRVPVHYEVSRSSGRRGPVPNVPGIRCPILRLARNPNLDWRARSNTGVFTKMASCGMGLHGHGRPPLGLLDKTMKLGRYKRSYLGTVQYDIKSNYEKSYIKYVLILKYLYTLFEKQLIFIAGTKGLSTDVDVGAEKMWRFAAENHRAARHRRQCHPSS